LPFPDHLRTSLTLRFTPRPPPATLSEDPPPPDDRCCCGFSLGPRPPCWEKKLRQWCAESLRPDSHCKNPGFCLHSSTISADKPSCCSHATRNSSSSEGVETKLVASALEASCCRSSYACVSRTKSVEDGDVDVDDSPGEDWATTSGWHRLAARKYESRSSTTVKEWCGSTGNPMSWRAARLVMSRWAILLPRGERCVRRLVRSCVVAPPLDRLPRIRPPTVREVRRMYSELCMLRVQKRYSCELCDANETSSASSNVTSSNGDGTQTRIQYSAQLYVLYFTLQCTVLISIKSSAN
jgi:hypothetical protein